MRSLVVRLLVLFAALVWAPAAMAQVKATLVRDGEPHQEGFQYDISREDCEDDEVYNFTVPFAALPAGADSFEVSISEGSDNCASGDERNNDSTTCALVIEATLDNTDGKTLKARPTTRQLADALSNVDDCVDTSTSTNERPVTIYFLIFSNGGAEEIPAENYGTWTDTSIDLLGPDPAGITKATPADEAFTVELSGVDFSTGDAFSFQLYCDPPIVDDGGGDGGATSSDGGGSATAAKPQGATGGASGTGGGNVGGAGGGGASAGGAGGGGENAGGGSSTAECGTGALVQGEPPPLANKCGSAITNGNEITITGAVNNRVYAVAVAGVDELGNPGVLSSVVCVTPVPVDDFFKVYNRAGGEGGCIGGCSSSGGQSAGLLAGLLLLGLVIARRRKQAFPRGGWLGLAGLLALGSPSFAEAQPGIADNNWRHQHRPDPPPPDVDFAFEVRFAPYWAHVDDEPALNGATPYESTFGDDPTFYFGLEFDYTPIRIPYVGALGAGVGWGYTWNSAKARLTDCPEPFGPEDEECLSSDDTTLEIMPMHASLVLRADELMRRTGVPLVPYGKFGFGWAYWKASKTSGVTEIDVPGEKENLFGEDVTIGLHAALGLAFALNWLDTRSAGALRESTGIAHMYLMAEWMNAMLTGLGGGQMRVGTSTFVTGLAADF